MLSISSALRLGAKLTVMLMLVLPGTGIAAPGDMLQFEGESDGRLYEVDTRSPEPIIEYWLKIDLLPESGDRPVVQVFGDGRVNVHRPVYMKDAGDYELVLTQDQLKDLLRSFGKRGLMDFDKTKYRSKRAKAAEAKLKKTGSYTVISDSMTTTIDVRLDGYRARNNAQKRKDFRKRIRVKDIEHDARQLTDANEVQDLAASVTRIRGLMRDTIERGWRNDAR